MSIGEKPKFFLPFYAESVKESSVCDETLIRSFAAVPARYYYEIRRKAGLGERSNFEPRLELPRFKKAAAGVRSIWLVVLALFFFHSAIEAQRLRADLNGFVIKKASDSGFSGTVLVSKNGKVILHKRYGLEDPEK